MALIYNVMIITRYIMGDNVNSKNDGSTHKKVVARRTKKWSQDARKRGAQLKVMRHKNRIKTGGGG